MAACDVLAFTAAKLRECCGRGQPRGRAMPLLREDAWSVVRLIRRFLPYLYCVRWQVAAAGLMALATPAVAIALLWLMKLLVDQVFVLGQMNALPGIVGAYLALTGSLLLVGYVFTRLEAALLERITQN